MKYLILISVMLLVLFSGCKGGKKDEGKGYPESGFPRAGVQGAEKPLPPVSVSSREKEPETGFFKGGITEKNGKRFGIYHVAWGDSVWIIAEKVVRDYTKQSHYGKADVGNWFYKINLANFATNFGGVKDNLKAGERILIPLD